MDTLSNVESETRRSESFAHTGAPDNFSSYRDAPPGLLQKRLLDDGDKEEARTVKKKEKKKRGKGKRRKKREKGGEGGEKKIWCALFDGENSRHTGRRHGNRARPTR